MRRGLAALVLGVSLVLGSVAWAGFVMNRTVLDPGRSERLADQLFDNEALRAALVGRIADAMGAAIPEGAPVVADQLLTAAADAALDDPSVQAVVREGIVATHRNALEGNATDVTIDATAVGAATREALVQSRPELAAVLPEVPALAVALPTSGLARLGAIKDFVERATIILAAASLIGAASALVITSNRPAVLRRVAFWAFGAAAFWLVVGYGIPFLADTIAPTSSAIVVAIIDVFFGAMIGPAVALAVVGAGLFALSMLWSSMAARRPAHVVQPMRADRGTRPKAGGVSQIRHAPSGPTRQASAEPSRPVQTPPQTMPAQTPPTSSAPPGTHAPSAAGAGPPTTQQPIVSEPGGNGPTGSDAGTPGEEVWAATPQDRQERPQPGAPQRWVEGVGYVDDDAPAERRSVFDLDPSDTGPDGSRPGS